MAPVIPEFIYKIVDAIHWKNAQGQQYLPPMSIDEADGYMHFSTAAQLAKTLTLHFSGQKGLAILAVKTQEVESKLTWEPSRGGDLFPHLYGQLPMSIISQYYSIDVPPEGACILPSEIV